MTGNQHFAVDTSVAVPLMVSAHAAHELVRSRVGTRSLVLSGRALVETYSVLTRLPGDARLAPADAVSLIDANFVEILPLPSALMVEAHRLFARAGVAGGATYDGLVALAAREHDVTLVTRDARARPTYEAIGARVETITAATDLG